MLIYKGYIPELLSVDIKTQLPSKDWDSGGGKLLLY